jgi:hypothetical protein
LAPYYEAPIRHESCQTTGRYLFANSGMLFPPAFGVTEPTSAAHAAGFHIFHGDGTATDIVTVRINGETVLENFVGETSYTVNSDCTGTYTVPNGPSFGMFIAPKGDAIAFIGTGPGNQVSDIRRIPLVHERVCRPLRLQRADAVRLQDRS